MLGFPARARQFAFLEALRVPAMRLQKLCFFSPAAGAVICMGRPRGHFINQIRLPRAPSGGACGISAIWRNQPRILWGYLKDLKGGLILSPFRPLAIARRRRSFVAFTRQGGLYGFTQAVLVSRNKWPRIGLGGAGRLSLAFCRFCILRQNFRAAANFAHGMEWAEILLKKLITGIVFFCFGNLSTPPGHFGFSIYLRL